MKRKKAKKILKYENCSEFLSTSVETVTSNKDLVMEILLRVPAKSLIRLKCVCKGWNTLISTSRFAYNQYAQDKRLVSSIYFNYHGCQENQTNSIECFSLQGQLSVANLSFLDEFRSGKRISLEHSCNGLMLFKYKDWFGSYCVCNLTTRKYVILPQDPRRRYGIRAFLVFDPLLSPYFKVVVISNPIYIYFSENKSWKNVQFNATLFTNTVAFWDGMIHWMNEGNTYSRFIVDEERLMTTQMPRKPKILKANYTRFFGECDGHLLLIQCRYQSAMGFKILEMKKGTSCWNVKYLVNLRRFPHVQPTKGRNFHVLGILRGSSENDLTLVLATPSKLFSYNLKRKTVDFMGDFSSIKFEGMIAFPGYRISVGRSFPFIENLCPC